MTESGRIIRVSIEMDLKEGEHFNLDKEDISDVVARQRAEDSMINMISVWDPTDWIQSRILSEEKDGNSYGQS